MSPGEMTGGYGGLIATLAAAFPYPLRRYVSRLAAADRTVRS
jgi:hypothetical protein